MTPPSPASPVRPEPHAGQSTAAPPEGLPDRSAVSSQPASASGLVRLDGYQILGKLGGGGMGTVWRAIQLSTRREVALKLLNLGLVGSDKARQRFDREVDITSHLQHPNIARIYDSGVHQGAYFYAMELVEGVPLDDFVRNQKLPRPQFLRLMVLVCQAVQHAHQRGVIHRDIKPSNILVTADGQPHLLDFGLGKYCHSDSDTGAAPAAGQEQMITLEGEWAGTPAFMSPEQAAGRVQDLDTRSDVYSLGVVLFHTLTGRYPHDTAGPQIDVLRRIIEDDIVRPRTAKPDLDPELESLLCKALAKLPGDRYPTAGALAADIVNYLEGEPLTARPLTASYFLRRKLRKHRMAVSIAATVVVALLTLAVAVTLRVRHERDLAREWAQAERAQKNLAELRLADSLVLWGSALRRDDKLSDAKARLWEAHDLQTTHGVIPVGADMMLLDSYDFSPPPLVQFTVPSSSSPWRGMARISNEGTELLEISTDGRLHTYDLVAGRELSVIGPPAARMLGGAIFADQRSFARVVPPAAEKKDDQATTLELIDCEKGAVKHHFGLLGELKTAPVFSRSGRYMAYLVAGPATSEDSPGEEGSRIVVQDVLDPTGRPLMSLAVDNIADHDALAFADEGTQLLSAGRSLSMWNIGDGTRVWTMDLERRGGSVQSLAVSCDGVSVVLGGADGQVYVVDLVRREVSRQLGILGGLSRNTALSPDGTRCIAADWEGTIRMWDLASGELLREFATEPGREQSIGYSADGRLIYACSSNGNVWVWSSRAGNPKLVSRFDKIITSIAISPDGRLAAVGHENRSLLVNDIETGRTLLHFTLTWPVASITFSADGAAVLAADDQGYFYRMDLRKGSIIQQFEQVRPVRMGDPPRNPNSLHSCKTVFSADGRRSFSYSIKGGALWDTETGQQLQLVESAPVGAATFTTDGKQVIYVIETPKILKSVNLENGNTWQVPLGKWGITTVLTTSSDDKTLLIGHYQGAVRALDLTTFQWKWQVIKHLRPVRSLAMTRDGRTAISCSADGLVLVWDVVNGRHVHSFNVGQNIRAATMSPDGTRIISSSGDGTSSRVWDLARLPGLRPPQKELQAAWARLREDPKDARAAAVCAKWYIDSDCSDWAQRTLAAVDGDVAGAKQVISARTLWLSGQNAAAVEAFSQLRQKSSAVEDQQYLALCAFAAAQENRR